MTQSSRCKNSRRRRDHTAKATPQMSKSSLIFGSGLLLFVAMAILFALARPSIPRRVSVSFLGYTNMPNSQTISALVMIKNNDSVPILFDVSSEDEGMRAVRVQVIPPTTALPLGCGESSVHAVDAPLGRGRWRVRLEYFRCTVKERLYYMAWKRRVTRKLPNPLPTFVYPSARTTNSVWLVR